jgi:outer membrane protein assembly factor BamA
MSSLVILALGGLLYTADTGPALSRAVPVTPVPVVSIRPRASSADVDPSDEVSDEKETGKRGGKGAEDERDEGTEERTAASASDDSKSFPRLRGPRPRRPIPPPETLEATGAIIGDVRVVTNDIFDPENPEENYKLFRLANRLHPKTHKRVIEGHLLFAPGERYSRYKIEESERILRSQSFLYDAEVRPIRYENNRVDLAVVTRDVWTLQVGVSVNRSGGETESSFEIQDANFLGSGKELVLGHATGIDRTETRFAYRDPNLLQSRARMELLYSDNSDGDYQKLKIERPFFSLDTRWAAGLEVVEGDRIDSFYRLGEVVDEVRHQQTLVEVRGGLSKGLQDSASHRWLHGFTYEHDRFDEGALGSRGEPLVERTLSYPWLEYQFAQNRFLKTRNVHLMGRTEDLPLGHRLRARIGWSSAAFGGDRDRAVLRTSYGAGFERGDDQLLLFEGYFSSRFGTEGEENLRTGVRGRFYWRNWGRHTFYALLSLDANENLDPERQLLLGGDSGLRGYPLRYQSGDRRALLTLEQRFFTDWTPFSLAYVGGAVFLDVGRAWFTGAERESELGTLTNVGFGLRISPSRSGFGNMLHVDLAFPLDGDSSIDSVQFLVTTRETF